MSSWLYETVHYHNGDIGLKRLDENEEPLFVVRTAEFAKGRLQGKELDEVVMKMFEAAMAVLGNKDKQLFDDVFLHDENLSNIADSRFSAYDMSFDNLLPSIH